MQTILDDVSFGVSSVGNTKALLMCLSSVLMGESVPKLIQIRFEGHLPSFDEFYMAQLSDLARFKGVEFIMSVAKPEGVRKARDWHMDFCQTNYLWMGDDDCVYEPDCLAYLKGGVDHLLNYAKPGEKFLPRLKLAYLCGTKGDLNNRRGWGNFKMEIKGAKDVHDNCPFNWFYDKKECERLYPEIYTADTGNILINLPAVRRNKICFSLFEESLNSGGEDTLFALECRHKGLNAFMVPSARGYHLEKPVVNFTEHAARAEMILRVADLRGYSGKHMDYVRKVFFPWLFKN